MYEHTNRTVASERREDAALIAVRAFLIERERRVIIHCQKLLKLESLSSDDRGRISSARLKQSCSALPRNRFRRCVEGSKSGPRA